MNGGVRVALSGARPANAPFVTDGEKGLLTALVMIAGYAATIPVYEWVWKRRYGHYRRAVATVWLDPGVRYFVGGAKVRYEFSVDGKTYGGTSRLEKIPWGRAPGNAVLSHDGMIERLKSEEGFSVGIFYDPKNPERHFFHTVNSVL